MKSENQQIWFFVELDVGVKVLPTQEEGGEYPVRETEEELSQPASLSESHDQIHRALLNPFTAENSSQSQDRSEKLSKEKILLCGYM